MIIQTWTFNDGGDEMTLFIVKLQQFCLVPLKESLLYLQNKNMTAKTEFTVIGEIPFINGDKGEVVNSCVL